MPNVIKSTQVNDMYSTYVICQPTRNERPSPRTAEEAREKILSEAMDEAAKIEEAAKENASLLMRNTNLRLAEMENRIRTESREEGYRQGVEQGKAEGYKAGYAQGQLQAKQEEQELLDATSHILQEIEQQKSAVLEDFSADLKKLALAIAQKVIKTELTVSGKAMGSIITNAVEAYRNQEWLKIYVSRNMAELLNNTDPPVLTTLHEMSETVKIVICPDMKDEDCILEMPDQMIEAGMDTQMSKIESALMI